MSAPMFLTPAELCERYSGQVTLKTLANWRHRGGGPRFTKIGRKVLYSLADVEAWEAERKSVSGPQYERR